MSMDDSGQAEGRSDLSLIWLGTVLTQSEAIREISQVQDELRSTVDKNLTFFDDAEECETFIRSQPLLKNIVLLIDETTAKWMLKRIPYICQIIFTFVIQTKSHRRKRFRRNHLYKVAYVTLDQVVSAVKVYEARRQRYQSEFLLILTDDTPDRSCTLVNAGFVKYHNIIGSLLKLEPSPSDMHELIREFSKKFVDNSARLKQLDEFYKTYVPENAVWWYTKDTFFFRLLNWALRIQNIELLYLFRFFIQDIRKQLLGHQWPELVHAYRGQIIAKEELDTLSNLIGRNICFKSFLSASRKRDAALLYLGDCDSKGQLDDGYTYVVFEIEADAKNNTHGRRPFAEIGQFSAFGYGEEEILFMLGAVFHIIDVYPEDNIWTIKMILWNYEDHDFNNASAAIQYNLGINTNIDSTDLLQFCSTLLNVHENQLAERLLKNHLNALRLSNVNKNNDAQIGQCYHKLGHCALQQANFKLAVQRLKKALNLFINVLPVNHLIIAATYLSLGNALSSTEKEERAFRSYEKALSIYRQYYDEESPEIQACYANISAYDISGQAKNRFPQLARSKGTSQDLCEAVEVNNKQDLDSHPNVKKDWEMLFSEYSSLSTIEADNIIFREKILMRSKTIPPSLLNQATIGRLVSQFMCPIIIYTCPCCKRRVWIYKVFGMFKGSPCFLCMRRALFFGGGSVRQ